MASLASGNGPSVTAALPSVYETRAPVEGGKSPSSPSSTPAFCRLLLYSIILATVSALGAASAAADSYPLGITTIMKRIPISFILHSRSYWDASLHWLFYSYVEQVASISTF